MEMGKHENWFSLIAQVSSRGLQRKNSTFSIKQKPPLDQRVVERGISRE
jgi:hypothetical protein